MQPLQLWCNYFYALHFTYCTLGFRRYRKSVTFFLLIMHALP